jgi:glutamyl-tRNA reductase
MTTRTPTLKEAPRALTSLCAVGINHKTAPVALREQVAFESTELPAVLAAVAALPGVQEAVVLGTCNRVEIYAAGDPDQALASLSVFLHEHHGLEIGTLDDHLQHRLEDDATLHLFRVAASLDAVVVGEPQILGQVKDAFFHAVHAGTAGPVLTRAFHRAFSAAKRVRQETRIAASAVSVASAGVELAEKIFGNLAGLSTLLVGAGDMGELAARHFGRAGARLTVANRSLDRALRLAREHGGVGRSIEELPALLVDADVVLVSTGAPGFVITDAMAKEVISKRRYRPLFLVDISVPRNVDPRVNDLDDCYVYDVDDLGAVVEENLSGRRREAERAEQIVVAEAQAARTQVRALRAVPLIKALRQHFTAVAEAEAQKTLAVLAEGASEKQRRSVEAMAQAIVNKTLHAPTERLRQLAESENSNEVQAVYAALCDCFGLTLEQEHKAAAEKALAEADAALDAGADADELDKDHRAA